VEISETALWLVLNRILKTVAVDVVVVKNNSAYTVWMQRNFSSIYRNNSDGIFSCLDSYT